MGQPTQLLEHAKRNPTRQKIVAPKPDRRVEVSRILGDHRVEDEKSTLSTSRQPEEEARQKGGRHFPVPGLVDLPPQLDADICKPYPSEKEAVDMVFRLHQFFDTVYGAWFPAEAKNLWLDYLYGKSGAQRLIFEDPSNRIVRSFRDSEEIEEHQDLILGYAKAAVLEGRNIAADRWTEIPVFELLRRISDRLRMPFSRLWTVPGNLAGGKGTSPFGDDSRRFSGSIRIYRKTDGKGRTLSVVLESCLKYIIQDSLDFCFDADPGWLLEKQVTIPLSRLEAMGWAKPLGFEVRFTAPTRRLSSNHAEITRGWPVNPEDAGH